MRHSGETDAPGPADDAERVEPGLGDALIGCAIGFLLIYVGSLIPYWALRWSVIAIGALFVVVKCAEIAQNDLGETSLASPAVDGTSLFIRTGKGLYRTGGSR